MSDEKDVFRVTRELGLKLRSLRKQPRLGHIKSARRFAQPALTGPDLQLRRR